MVDFEQKVLQGIISCGVKSGSRIGVAVSGGADSISLLNAVYEIVKNCQVNQNVSQKKNSQQNVIYLQPEINVITVNHNIRSAEESGGDAKFVQNFCSKLNSLQLMGDGPEVHCKNSLHSINVSCTIVELEPGLVRKTANERGQGIEDAARVLRYEAFERFIKEKKLNYLCLAHNQNDQMETVLMRFISGGAMETLAGIKAVRGVFIRPMLNISRPEIEAYLCKAGLSWRTDSTNADTAYLRNKIRLKVIPFLDEVFGEWKQSVLSGAKRAQADSQVIAALVDKIELKEVEGGVSIAMGEAGAWDCGAGACFGEMLVPIKQRVLLRACSLAGETMRVPLVFIDEFLRQSETGKNVNLQFHNVELSLKNNNIFVRKSVKTHTQTVFSAIIEDNGTYEFPFGKLVVSKSGRVVINDILVAENIELPCCIRSTQLDDEVLTADGRMKKVNDVFSDWHVPVELRSSIPVLQKLKGKNQEIFCIFGGVYGFNNWVVK